MRRLRFALLAGLLAALALWPGVALAHAGLVRSDPPALCPGEIARGTASSQRCATGTVLQAAPPVVRLWFSEPVRPVGRGITVIAPSGRQVQDGAVEADGAAWAVRLTAAEEGTYQVRWQVIAADTHPARGYFTFSVVHPSALPAPDALLTADQDAVSPWGLVLQAVARWLHYLGYALAFGPIAFQTLIWPRGDHAAALLRLRRLGQFGIGLLLAAEPVALLAQTASLGTIFDPDLLGDVMSTSFGRILAMRLGATLLLWVVQGALQQTGRRQAWPLLLIGLALAALDSGASHTVAAGLPGASLLLFTLHLTAMGLWVGGLAALLVVWRTGLPRPERAMLVAHFGRLAAGAVAVLAISGSALAAAQLTSLGDLLTTPYGQVLSAKLIGVSVALGLAFWGKRADDSGRHRFWTGEAWVQALVLALAALLATVPPPH